MINNIIKIIDKIEELGWTVTEEGANQYMFSKFSHGGQDFNIEVEGEDVEDIIYDIYKNYEDFDVSEETYLWLDETGHGVNGAPYDKKDLYEDMEACREMILDLYNALRN